MHNIYLLIRQLGSISHISIRQLIPDKLTQPTELKSLINRASSSFKLALYGLPTDVIDSACVRISSGV